MHFRRDRSRSAKGYTVLVRPGLEIPIILPVLPASSLMQASHLSMVKRLLREVGPDDVEQLDLLLHGREKREHRSVPVS